MAIEVEQKFPVSDPSELAGRLAELGFRQPCTLAHVDCYYAHPVRDFAAGDEALRLRRAGDNNYLTYKGPKLDTTTKTRREVEISLASGPQSAADAAELLEALGFRCIAEVTKRRVHAKLRWQDSDVGVSLDEVEGLGHFVELEILTTKENLDRARRCLASLASHLNLTGSERRSYLELVLERGG